ncbi:unnamed protein product [Lactuca saligna]|uniref:Uncharacterized protein n=1 Tax=Lactuca saligna TaxID=75948 RepID=A0AA35YM13_LACSI|nr:unnamed protein product [Lactuca saligna]
MRNGAIPRVQTAVTGPFQIMGQMTDAISGTDDNITPSTVDKNSVTSPMNFLNTTPVLKRNLEEVFDLDINENLSSSKTPKVSLDGPRKKLLEIKLEKSG